MDGLSNIFKGKVMGSEHIHTPTEDVQELNVVKKIKALEEGHFKNLTEQHKMKMFGITERMKNFNSIKPKNNLQPATDKLRAMGIISYSQPELSSMEMKKYKSQDKLQAINARMKLQNLGLLPKAQNIQNIRGLAFNQELESWKTIGQRRQLNPFEDTDKDRVPNFLDCKPLNKKKQGWYDNLGVYHDDTGTIAPVPETQYQSTVGATTMNPTEVTPGFIMDTSNINRDIDKVSEVAPNLGQKIMLGLSEAYQSGKTRYQAYQQNRQTQQVWEAAIRKKAQEAALTKAYQLKAEQIYQRQGQKILRTGRQPQQMSGIREANIALSQGARDISMGYDAAVNPLAKQRIRELTGMGGSPSTIQGILSLDRPALPLYVKVDEWYGKGEKAKRYYQQAPAIQRTMIQQPTQYSQTTMYPQTYAAPPSTTSGGVVLSPYSKRPVRYTRGPYKSHKVMAQPQAQYY
jgi:hypothetical protein